MSSTDNTPAGLTDAVDKIKLATGKLAAINELFGIDWETCKYPVLQSPEARLGVFFSIQESIDSLNKAAEILDSRP